MTERVLLSADRKLCWSGTEWTKHPHKARIYTDSEAKELRPSVLANNWQWMLLDPKPIDWDAVGTFVCVFLAFISVVVAPIVVVIGLLLK